MDTPTPPGRPPGSDPLLVPPAVGNPTSRSRPETGNGRTDEHRPPDRRRPPRRRHPASGARAIALTASVVATGAVAAALAYSEGAWSADDDPAAGPSTAEPATSPEVSDSASVTTVADTGTADTGTDSSDSTSDGTSDGASTSAETPTSTSTAPTTTATTQPADTTSQPSGYADGVYPGTAEYTEWGDVQVQVTISDGTIVEIEALQYPTGRRSSSINNEAIPLLEADAIAWQTADLDVVTGATYTSWTYAASLQSALDRAAAAATQEVDTA